MAFHIQIYSCNTFTKQFSIEYQFTDMYFCLWELTILTSLVCACDAQKFHAKIEKKKPGFEFLIIILCILGIFSENNIF